MDSVRKDSQNFLHPADCCYKAKPCDSDDADARMVVRLHDYKTAYARISALEAERDRAVERIAALEAERDKLREMVMKLANEVDCTNIASLHRRKPLVDQAKALVGGEVKHG